MSGHVRTLDFWGKNNILLKLTLHTEESVKTMSNRFILTMKKLLPWDFLRAMYMIALFFYWERIRPSTFQLVSECINGQASDLWCSGLCTKGTSAKERKKQTGKGPKAT